MQVRPSSPLIPISGLPPLVGLPSMREVVSTGLTVNESVGRLKRIRWSSIRLRQIFVSRITSAPIYELISDLPDNYRKDH